jgi:hypothetical protein
MPQQSNCTGPRLVGARSGAVRAIGPDNTLLELSSIVTVVPAAPIKSTRSSVEEIAASVVLSIHVIIAGLTPHRVNLGVPLEPVLAITSIHRVSTGFAPHIVVTIASI